LKVLTEAVKKSEQKKKFDKAKYANLRTEHNSKAGHVRQAGNLSFSRIFRAGHVPSRTQPEATREVFRRIIHGLAIDTGDKTKVLEDYKTEGEGKSRYDYPPEFEPEAA
jgi:hypothetical protein